MFDRLKIRAWNKRHKYHEYIEDYYWFEENYVHDPSNCNDYIFEQYTGLKDKNGRLIYEGDIVRWDDCSNGEYWRIATVAIDPDIQFRAFDCPLYENSSQHGHTFHYGNFIYTDTENYLEVIGNIHENPELLDV